ncbi:MAG TPA: hypothetical protein VJV96_11790 [Candidatus Angelobacter sp.]|nr:hypothetical protein [Candidatus Angelobacter sp.]HKT50977.1 hypothetical protein [Candidatus Angelobacter sp.]
MNINMTEAEAELVRDILAQHHRELLLEIARAEHHEFKLALQKREKLLRELLEKLQVVQPAHS